jgi:hypothetical protein
LHDIVSPLDESIEKQPFAPSACAHVGSDLLWIVSWAVLRLYRLPGQNASFLPLDFAIRNNYSMDNVKLHAGFDEVFDVLKHLFR